VLVSIAATIGRTDLTYSLSNLGFNVRFLGFSIVSDIAGDGV
jgi:hypothetical protein